MQRFLTCFLMSVVVLFAWNCRKTQESHASGKPKNKTSSQSKVLGAKQLDAVMERLNTALEQVNQQYKYAYHNGKIRSWESFHNAQRALKDAQALFRRASKTLRRQKPALAAKMAKTLQVMQSAMKKKSHPQLVGQASFQLRADVQSISPSLRNELLSSYKETMKTLRESLAAEQVSGPYRVGIFVQSPRPFYRWTVVRRSMRKITLRPPARSRWLLGVVLRDAKTNAPLTGAEVSIELLDGKSKKQLSTQKAWFVWRGYPSYVANIPNPKRANLVVQVTVSPFPIRRSARSVSKFRRRLTVHFPAKARGGALQFQKAHAVRRSTETGDDVLRAAALVGGQTRELGPYRVGVALLPNQTVYDWKGGGLRRVKRGAGHRFQLVAFVQDRRTGLLIPDARLEAFLYYKLKGNTYRSSYNLHPVYDGFAGYRVPLTLKQDRSYLVRVSVRPAPHGRFTTRLPSSFMVEFPDLRSAVANFHAPAPRPRPKKR